MDKREWRKWIDGAVNTIIGGAVASVLDILTSPAGEFHWKLIVTLLLWNFKSYLKDHPLPLGTTVVESKTTIVTSPAGESVKVQEAKSTVVEPPGE